MLKDFPSQHTDSFHIAESLCKDWGFDPQDVYEYGRALVRGGRTVEQAMKAIERQVGWQPTVTMTAPPPTYNGGSGLTVTVNWMKLNATQKNKLMKDCA